MNVLWKEAEEAFDKNIQIEWKANNAPVKVLGHAKKFYCIGVGTDAAVFCHIQYPEYAFKVYAPEAVSKKEVEREVYRKIRKSIYFPECFGSGTNFIGLSRESGKTLHECLLEGIHIPGRVIEDVDHARAYIRTLGLNPRDIHHKNVLLKDGRAKLLDVSEYVKQGNDKRWEHLKQAYDQFYPMVDRRKVPLWVLGAIKKWYKRSGPSFSVDEFGKRMIQLLHKDKNNSF